MKSFFCSVRCTACHFEMTKERFKVELGVSKWHYLCCAWHPEHTYCKPSWPLTLPVDDFFIILVEDYRHSRKRKEKKNEKKVKRISASFVWCWTKCIWCDRRHFLLFFSSTMFGFCYFGCRSSAVCNSFSFNLFNRRLVNKSSASCNATPQMKTFLSLRYHCGILSLIFTPFFFPIFFDRRKIERLILIRTFFPLHLFSGKKKLYFCVRFKSTDGRDRAANNVQSNGKD